ncbi:hypothetical protein DEIPH_ctg094orf0006 [Deinococcus phoenicis]|uniref:Oxidoreductase molybdopterin-binding domain-containing protein n=1 Tax=Deinococcus phoenicis TaxID=1476583 RepID=A0A016QLF3_9DEIO|nr:molybdopterin-dependent oxidoreductase [Deinococcus phoenicis]EYB66579.1 hypothetical protein DEIPH_ctg094orf0006 [Deinococcus phoenicis]
MFRTVSLGPALLWTLGTAQDQTQPASGTPATVTAPAVSTAATPIVLTGAAQTPHSSSLADLRTFPSRTLTVSSTSGGQSMTHTYRGVLLFDLLKAPKPNLNAGTKNDALRWGVLARGADGYTALFSWGELDPDFRNRPVLLAYEEDRQPLPARDGAVRLVVPGDGKGGRYVSNLVELQGFRTGP